MSDCILAVDSLGKAFVRYHRERHRFMNWLGFTRRPAEEFWAVRDISFNLARGETVGLVGQNGAGKSTLLKLITGTLRPTSGAIHLNGRISAILELGMGFHQEMTGRQNVFNAAGLMGFHLHEIRSMLPEIEDFAEIGEFFDQPVRTYSSGMQMRLAFAVATASRPELLIIDEALSVGDTYFQHKSFERIRNYRSRGTGLLIVSHDKSSVQILCDRAMLMHKGRIIKDDKPETVMDYYNALLSDEENRSIKLVTGEDGRVGVQSGTGQAGVIDISLLNKKNEPVKIVGVDEEVKLLIKVRVNSFLPRLVLGYMIKNYLGQPVFGTNTYYTGQILEEVSSDTELVFSIAFRAALGPGSYSVAVNLSDSRDHLANNYEWRDLALVFNVVNHDLDEFMGLVWIPPRISIEKKQDTTR